VQRQQQGFVGTQAPGVVRAPAAIDGNGQAIPRTSPAVGGGPERPPINRSQANKETKQTSGFDAEYEQQLRQLREVLTPEAVSELTATLPPSELQNLQRVLADLKRLDAGMQHQAAAPGSSARSMRARMAAAPMSATPSHAQHATRGLRPTVGMDAASQLAARQQSARRAASDLGLSFEFYNYMKTEVFAGSTDAEMAQIAEIMGLEHLQQLADVYQELSTLYDQPFDTLAVKYAELSQRMEQLMAQALGGAAAAVDGADTHNAARSIGSESEAQDAAPAASTSKPAKPWGSSLATPRAPRASRKSAASPAGPAAASAASQTPVQSVSQAPALQAPGPAPPPIQNQQPASHHIPEDDWVLPQPTEPVKTASRQRALLTGSGAKAGPGRPRGRGPLFGKSGGPPSNPMS